MMAANGLPIRNLRTLEVPFEYGETRIVHPTIIVEQLNEDLILGCDFFKAAGLHIGRQAPVGAIYEKPLEIRCEKPLNEGDLNELYDVVSTFYQAGKGRIGKTTVLQHQIELIEGAKPALLREVASRLKRAKLTINVKKSIFFAKSVKYVGYILSEEGISADPEKVEAVRNYPRPKTLREVRRFLGMTGYYRRLIENYSEIATPLTNLLRKMASKMNWTEKHEEAFQVLKEAMMAAPVVATPNFDLEFTLQCDASDLAAGAALGQIQTGREVVIAYFSHKWAGNEKVWGATEKEAAAVLMAIKYFRHYLWGRKFTVITDAKALSHVKTIHADGAKRLSRWVMELNSYDMVIKHRAGKLSVVPDAISRAVEEIKVSAIETSATDEFQQQLIARIRANPFKYAAYVIEGNRIRRMEKVRDDIGCVAYRWKEYVPVVERPMVIRRIHAALKHLGASKCIEVIRRSYFWPDFRESVKTELRSCEICKGAKVRGTRTRMPLGVARNARMPFEMIAIDHWGPVTLIRRRNKYLLVIVVDIFSKYVILKACPNTKAAKVVEILEEEGFCRFNPPRIIITDNFRPLIGRRMGEFL